MQRETNDKSSARRLPEDTAQARHRALVLHNTVPPPWGAGACADLSALGASARRGLSKAVIYAACDADERALLDVTKDARFVRLSSAVQRRLLDEAASMLRARLSPQELFACLRHEGFVALSPRAQSAAIRELGPKAWSSATRSGLLRLLGLPAVALLDTATQVALIEWFGGPEASPSIAAMRKSRLALAWEANQREILHAVSSSLFARLDLHRQSQALVDFLHRPCRPVWRIDATALNGHAAIVFGDPAHPRALSYGRRFVISDRHKTPFARIHSPDPTIQSGWRKPAVDASTTYAAERILLSRLDERAVIAWIEKSQPIAEDERPGGALGARVGVADPATFIADVERLMASLAARGRGADVERCYLRAGRIVEAAVESDVDLACDRLVSAWIAA
jgi:hypothetical protein